MLERDRVTVASMQRCEGMQIVITATFTDYLSFSLAKIAIP